MKTTNKLIEILKYSPRILLFLDKIRIITLKDEVFLKYMYKSVFGKDLNLSNPQTFNEKLQWLKLYDRSPEYTKMVDKYEAKKYVADIIGNEYIIPTLGIYEKWEEIDFDKLPKKFVLKCTHDSGSTVICKDKESFDINLAKNKINKCLRKNFYYESREWPYKNIKPRIIIEKYMADKSMEDLNDYKIQCLDGKVDNIMVCVDRYKSTGVKYHYFDQNWNYLRYCVYRGIDAKNVNVQKPKQLEEMLEIAEKLSKNLPQLRVDLYIINEKIYFGELTFFTNSGFDTTITQEADEILGSRLVLTV